MNALKSQRGRGASVNPDSRFSQYEHEAFDDGWDCIDDDQPKLKTWVTEETAKTVITYNQSPDLPFDRSINPYRGCEHGCSYCYARPTHAYLDLSPGLDFESRLYAKTNVVERLKKELGAKKYRCKPVVLGANTDPYQPVEKNLQLTRGILEVLNECRHPVIIVTKSSLVERDIDLLSEMAEHSLAEVMVSVTTLNRDLARRMEPRAAAPGRRLETIGKLAEAKIPVGVMVAPVIPQLTDTEMESILKDSAERGAASAAYIMLRLPREVGDIFEDWLHNHYPLKAEHVLGSVRDVHDGKTNDSRFGSRLKGTGSYASVIAQRFQLCSSRLGLNREHEALDTTLFRPPREKGPQQMSLF